MRPVERNRCRGFGYLWALIAVAVMGIYLARVATLWSLETTRANEQQLLRAGGAIRQAVHDYVQADPGRTFPTRIEDLLRDPRVSYPRRFLRAPYPDPMTGQPWAVVSGPDGEFYGVYSTAEGVPLKQGGFAPQDAMFSQKNRYQDWTFVHYPGMSRVRR